MKKIICIMLSAVLLCLASCGTESKAENSEAGIAGENTDRAYYYFMKGKTSLSLGDTVEMYWSSSENEANRLDDDILSGKYGALAEQPYVSDMKVYACVFNDEPYGAEFGYFEMVNEEKAEEMKKFIERRFQTLKDNAKNYPSVDTTFVKSVEVGIDGNRVYYPENVFGSR